MTFKCDGGCAEKRREVQYQDCIRSPKEEPHEQQQKPNGEMKFYALQCGMCGMENDTCWRTTLEGFHKNDMNNAQKHFSAMCAQQKSSPKANTLMGKWDQNMMHSISQRSDALTLNCEI